MVQPGRWYTTGGLGVAYLKGMDVRWYNLGPRRHTAGEITIAGNRLAGPRFRICEACGHLDRTGLANKRDEHRPWCKHRHSHEEHTRSVLLTRKPLIPWVISIFTLVLPYLLYLTNLYHF